MFVATSKISTSSSDNASVCMDLIFNIGQIQDLPTALVRGFIFI
jgi:hypothetical protein